MYEPTGNICYHLMGYYNWLRLYHTLLKMVSGIIIWQLDTCEFCRTAVVVMLEEDTRKRICQFI